MEKKTRGRPKKAAEPAIAEVLTTVEKEENAFIDVFIIKSCKNIKWKQGIDKKANKCFVAVPKTLIHLLDGKWVKATKIDGTDENHYNFVA